MQILVIGWLSLFLYAYPGYMSFDSVYQLNEARTGLFSDGHPPAMSAMWQVLDMIVAGPLLMLLLQLTTFLAGLYLFLARRLSPRNAAIAAITILWFPPIGTVMSVIWKDSQMAGFLMLGAALVFSDRRRVRLLGIFFLFAATEMRHNAFAMTFAIIVVGFRWSDAHQWWKRYPIALVTWVGITLGAQIVNGWLTVRPLHLWHRSIAILDIVQTLRHMPETPDSELLPLFVESNLRQHDIWKSANRPFRKDLGYVDGMWTNTLTTLAPPDTEEERTAIARAWKAIVPKHPVAYLAYRWELFERVIQLRDPQPSSAVYIWFTDVFDPYGSATRIGHNGFPSWYQGELREGLGWIGTTFLFRPYLYLFLSFLLLIFCIGRRDLFAVVASGITGEAGLLLFAPTVDYRYSMWVIVTFVVGTILVVAERARRR